MIQIQDLSKSYGDQELIRNASFQLPTRARFGLVGANGSGKSTLFKMILGEEPTSSGQIIVPKNYQITTLQQHIKFTQKNLLDECLQALPEEDKHNHYIVEKILFGLGFEPDDLNKDPYLFSGGFQIRINLCKALVQNPNLLLLDEPTNYLDILSIRWLKSFLKSFPGEVLLITHDRDFMDSVCTHIMGIVRKQLKLHQGNTEKFYEQILIEEEIYEKTRLNQEKKRAHLQSFIDRFGAKASKATQAASRMKMIDRLEQMDELSSEETLSFKFNYQECPGKVLLEGKDLSFHYPNSGTLFKDLSFSVQRSDRIGVIGKNGQGKSTLLNCLGGVLIPSLGSVQSHPSLKIGHFGQTNVERLHPQNSIIQEILSANPELSHTAVRNICGTMMFSGDLAEKNIRVLSGGEKSRVLLGKILAQPTNLLLLDEPTNHLDMDSIESLCQEIQDYPGAIVMVTHSEYLLKNLVNKLIIFHRGGAEFFYGGYDDFLQKIGWEEEITSESGPKNKISYKDIKNQRAQIVSERAKVCGPLKKQIDAIESEIMKFEELVEKKNQELSKLTSEGKQDQILLVSQELGKFHIKISDLFDQLEPLSLEYESKKKVFDERLDQIK